MIETNQKHFRPKAHILRLLGEELIKNPVMAIYELIKNSYDADARVVDVRFENVDDLDNTRICIEDNGTGMTEEILDNVWLEPGTDFRKPFDSFGKRQIRRSPVFDRVPMGEKGVGRFAVHKLGDIIKLITRPAIILSEKDENGLFLTMPLDYELELTIDWTTFSQSKYLEEIPIEWNKKTNPNDFFFKRHEGTLIEITKLKETWTRGMARDLKRNTISMLSPKNDKKKFKIELDFGNKWLADFPDSSELLTIAPYTYTAMLDEEFNLTVDYNFKLENNKKIGQREITNNKRNIRGEIKAQLRKVIEKANGNSDKIEDILLLVDEKSKNPVGILMFEIYSYDLDPDSLRDYTFEPKILKDILSNHSGIKVFKDDLRVFNYGEQGNDWLELDLKRVQNKKWFSNNQNIGFVFLDSETSGSLVEKTNREGFIEDKVYTVFYNCLQVILEDFQAERFKDRSKWRSFNEKKRYSSFDNQISIFKELIQSTDLNNEEKKEQLMLEAEKVEKEYQDSKDTLLIPAGVGMTSSIALHEIEKLVPRMNETVHTDPIDQNLAIEQVEELDTYMKGILSVLRKGGNAPLSVKEAIEKAVSNYRFKLQNRNIAVESNLSEIEDIIKCDKRYFITMIMNVIDNSIYWLDTVYKEGKGIFVKTYKQGEDYNIVLVDNGPGFRDDIEDLVRPFFSRKADGIGIGLYLIDTIMMKYGKLGIITDVNELNKLEIPDKYRGAALKLTFNKNQ